MAAIVPVNVDGGTVYVEVVNATTPRGARIEEAGAREAAEKALDTAAQMASSIQLFCRRTVAALRELEGPARPNKASIEFGLSISVEGNVYVVKTAGEASIKITAEWDLAKSFAGKSDE